MTWMNWFALYIINRKCLLNWFNKYLKTVYCDLLMPWNATTGRDSRVSQEIPGRYFRVI